MMLKSEYSLSMRDTLLSGHATELLLILSEQIKGKRIFLACDKGNKRGVGHFVKIISYYDRDLTKVNKFVLDIDGSEGTTQDCANAVRASMKGKLHADARLSGQTTDSGGGGVLDGLAKALLRKDLCVSCDDYKVAPCTLHAIQLTLANPIKACIGEGELLPAL